MKQIEIWWLTVHTAVIFVNIFSKIEKVLVNYCIPLGHTLTKSIYIHVSVWVALFFFYNSCKVGFSTHALFTSVKWWWTVHTSGPCIELTKWALRYIDHSTSHTANKTGMNEILTRVDIEIDFASIRQWLREM